MVLFAPQWRFLVLRKTTQTGSSEAATNNATVQVFQCSYFLSRFSLGKIFVCKFDSSIQLMMIILLLIEFLTYQCWLHLLTNCNAFNVCRQLYYFAHASCKRIVKYTILQFCYCFQCNMLCYSTQMVIHYQSNERSQLPYG